MTISGNIKFYLYNVQYMRLLYFSIALLFVFCQRSYAQVPSATELGDSTLTKPILEKIGQYFFSNTDSAVYYAEKLYAIGVRNDNYKIINHALQIRGEGYRGKGDLPRSLQVQLEALKLNRAQKDLLGEAYTRSFLGFTYLQSGMTKQALQYSLAAIPVLEKKNEIIQASFATSNAAYCYIQSAALDSARALNARAKVLLEKSDENDFRKKALRSLVYDRIGETYLAEGKLEEAAAFFHQCLYFSVRDNVDINISRSQKNLARIFLMKNNNDSAIFYSWNALQNSRKDRQRQNSLEAAQILAVVYKNLDIRDSILFYQSIAMGLRDSVYGMEKFRDIQMLTMEEQSRQQEYLSEKEALRNTLRLAILAVIVVALIIVAVILRRNNSIKQKINLQLNNKTIVLEKTLEELKATQAQLIQSEKMASLGQLTAGIAHEIQNPLNFVNNFSDVNTELLTELKEEINAGTKEEASVLIDDIIENEKKINHHGKRADSIVKGMLQHSRAGSGEKTSIDINALADEYLRLSYHGFRSKDKDFNAKLITSFNQNIGRINIVPQDIGRVLLNLYSNAFYTMTEKKKSNPDYQPEITVSTIPRNGVVEISISDNGSGIPENLVDKIFQPFFTTKPTGEGTGLGLSLSYDIIKAHRGELEVKTAVGEGSAFIIRLPLNS
jgi:two-component system NtrC family sensor kinase